MASVLIATLVIVGVSTTIGRAIIALTGWERCWLAPAVGFAVLLIAGGAVQYAPGHALTVAVAVLAATVIAARFQPAPTDGRSDLWEGLAIAAGVFVLSSLPLIASGRAGILGAGNQNDMVAHLTTADWLQSHAGAATVLIKEGYPLGPHGIAAMVSQTTGMSLVHAFDGFTLAIPVLTALTALAALGDLPRTYRIVVAGMTALCYLAASYLVTGAFKETAEALLLLAFVLALRRFPSTVTRRRWALGAPLGLLAAGSVYVYSYLGVIWLIGAATVFGALELIARPGTVRERASKARAVLPALAGAIGVFTVATVTQAHRAYDFWHSAFSHEPVANTGNLVHAISPVQTLGVWLRSDFRFNMPTAVTVAVGVVAGVAAVLALVWWLRRRDFALPAGVLSAAFIYWYSTLHRNVYNQAKGLAIAAPLIALMVGAALAAWSAGQPRELLGQRARLVAVRAGALALLCAASLSSFLALRDGPVSADAHATDLAPVRSLVRGQPTLNMDVDDFSHWYLAGVDLGTGPLLYPTRTVPVRPGKPWRAPQPFDFDSWSAGSLNRFRYVVEPRSAYRSATPPGFELARRTRWFWVWKRTRAVHNRSVLEHGGHPNRLLNCNTSKGRALASSGGVASVTPQPVVHGWRAWRGQPRLAGQSAVLSVHLPRGRWDMSIQYISNVGLAVKGPGMRTMLPAHLGRIGPYWLAGTVRHVHNGRIHVRLTARRPGPLGKALGARGFTRALDVPGNLPLQGVAFTRHGAHNRVVPLRQACGRYVDWYRVKRG